MSESYFLSQELFLRFLALNYFFAFWSLSKQLMGLYGSQGIVPIQESLDLLKKNSSRHPFFTYPSLFWLSASDRTIKWAGYSGILLSLAALLGLTSPWIFFLLWWIYLSFENSSDVFLNFQWDSLLLEVGFIGIFFAFSPPAPLLIFALWFLLFRFLFSSGITKLLFGSREWQALTAMEYHYETQPLPNRIAYYMHKQSKYFAKLSVVVTYFFEIVVPFFFFFPGEIRMIACFSAILFQLLITLTGNFAFFNTLTIALCIPLIPDRYLIPFFGMPEAHAASPFIQVALNGIGALLIFLNGLQLVSTYLPLRSIDRLLYRLFPYRIINSYGLFVSMTTHRDEIIIEGSHDGTQWKTYEFKWKPGDCALPPKQVAPYHPRLDWQMWFASLSSFHQNPWLLRFLLCLLEGSPDVLALLKTNPFPDSPPKYIRSQLYRYHFTDLKTKKEKGTWWSRSYQSEYTPILSLEKDRLTHQ